MVKTESSNILQIGYDAKTERLRVRFNNGGLYEFADVPGEVADRFLKAESVGKHFHEYIKGQYKTERVEPNPESTTDDS